MSNIAIKGGATGTGVFTLESPATNTNRTLTLPDEAGTVLTSAGVPSSAMPAGSVLQVQYAKNILAGSVTNTTADIVTVSVTKQLSNSKFMIAGGTYLAKLSNNVNQDTADPSLMFRADGVTLVTGLTGSNVGGFWGSDVPVWELDGGSYGATYDMFPHNSMQEYVGSHAAGTTIVFSLALRTSTLGAYYNRSYGTPLSNGMTYIQVMEIAQ